MYVTVGAAILALDFCISKTLRVLRNAHSLYAKAWHSFTPPLQQILYPLQIEFKLGVATSQLLEYEQIPPSEGELTLRHVLKHMASTTELIECESNRLTELCRQLQRRWVVLMPPDWEKESHSLTTLLLHLDQQLNILLLLRRLHPPSSLRPSLSVNLSMEGQTDQP